MRTNWTSILVVGVLSTVFVGLIVGGAMWMLTGELRWRDFVLPAIGSMSSLVVRMSYRVVKHLYH